MAIKIQFSESPEPLPPFPQYASPDPATKKLKQGNLPNFLAAASTSEKS
jgi:hypothetical protein